MKKEGTQKRKKWIWLAAGLAVLLLIVGVVLAVFLMQGEKQDTGADGRVELYWNVDRLSYVDPVTFLSTREPGEDGLYYIRFAIDGQQVELPVADKKLVNSIDSWDVMGLKMDGDGVIVNVLAPETIATEVVKDNFVQEVEGNTFVVNSSKAMNGMELTVELTDKAGVYDVSPNAETVGQEGTLAQLDKVLVYADDQGEVTHVFITERAVEAGVYWRVERKYDTATAQSTRKPDENGVYTIQFAHDGALVDLKCRDVALVNEIDAGGQFFGEFALVFDEEGYIVDIVDVATALIGTKLCNNYNIFVVGRYMEDASVYYNTTRKYNATTQETTREPDENGYYVFDMICEGKQVQVKTKSKETASYIDRQNAPLVALEVSGGIVKKAYPAEAAIQYCTGKTANFHYVGAINGDGTFNTYYIENGVRKESQKTHKLAKDCAIYNVSTGYANDDGEIVYCYIANKHTRTAGAVSYCGHCGKDVFWEPYTGTVYQTDVHYYLTHDMKRTSQLAIGSEKAEEQPDIVFDLNGHTLTTEKRGFLVYGTLSILDSAGGGKVAAKNVDGSFGGCVMVAGGGTLNLYSGTLTTAEGGSVGSRGGVLYITGAASTLNMYGGTVTGGTVAAEEGTPFGGNIYLNGSTFNLYGGTVSNGSAGDTGYFVQWELTYYGSEYGSERNMQN